MSVGYRKYQTGVFLLNILMEETIMTVNIVKKGSEILSRANFKDLKKGDTFFINSIPHVAQDDAHLSGDASYSGYLVYDEQGEGWFPEDLN